MSAVMRVPLTDPKEYLMVGGLDNLANLQDLTEDNVLAEIKGRFDSDNVHTYVGDILIVMNPYQRFPVYTPEVRQFYIGGLTAKDDIAPHAYYIADLAYSRMCRSKQAQCFVISGESGAGKTESTKIVLKMIMDLCKAGKTALESQIQALNPFLEAFGNAKTLMNNNSSRFGKYLELKFEETSGSICGATMFHYLLEKSRLGRGMMESKTFTSSSSCTLDSPHPENWRIIT